MATGLREMYQSDPDARQVIDVAKGLEGLRRQAGIHAAAVVITREPLTQHLPIQRKPDPSMPAEHAPIVTQYEMHGVEELGLLKMDFLGLRNLSVIERTLDLVERSQGHRPDIDDVPLDDEATFAMLRQGKSVGVFQLDSAPMRALMRSLAPSRFEDVAALVALYRPGPMAANMHNDYADRKCGRKPITYLHPDLEDLLADTYGLMIYQESMMRVAQRFAGYSLSEADRLRKACGKKIRPLIAAEREKFVAGCEHTGYGESLGTALFDLIEPFADYAFNKSHSYGYGLVAYQTAWLKANYPVEYMAALLTSVKDDKDRTAVYLGECRAQRIQVLVPDVNVSASDFIAQPSSDGRSGAIPFGLSAIRNVGEGLVAHVVAERERGGPYRDFYDFCDRVDPAVLNKRTVESLIKAGAFDSLGHPRKGLCLVFEQVVDRTLSRRREAELGIMSLFSGVDDGGEGANDTGSVGFDDSRVPIPDVEFDKAQRLSFEKEMLGLYVSDHPLMGFETALAKHADRTISELRDQATGPVNGNRDGEVHVVGGVVTNLARKYTKSGDQMATFVLEDLEATIETFVFPSAMRQFGVLLEDDVAVCVRGRIDTRDDQPKLVCMGLTRPQLVADDGPPLRISLPLPSLTDALLQRLKQLFVDHPGPSPVFLHVGGKVLRLPDDLSVDARSGVVAEVRVLLGPNAVVS
jgi:DNA polymerase-3 subunit alpha